MGDRHGEIVEALIDAGAVHVARGQARVHIHIVGRPILAVGVGPEVPAVIAPIEANPPRVARLALSDEGHINPVGIRRRGAEASAVVVRHTGVGRHEVTVIKEGKGRPAVIRSMEGTTLRQRLVDQRVDRVHIRRMVPHVPHLPRLDGRPRLTAVQGPAKAVVGRHIDGPRVGRMDNHLVGRGTEVVEQIPGRSRIGRAVDLVVGHEVKR